MKLTNGLLITALMIGSASAVAGKISKEKCYKVGQTVTFRGYVQGHMNNGTFFKLTKPICINYPTSSNTRPASHLTTIGEKLPPDIFLDVTGVLHDSFERGLVGFDIYNQSAVDVNAIVEAEIMEREESCKKWQTENTERMSKKSHGGKVMPLFVGNTDRCGLSAADTMMPHDTLIIEKPEPKK